MIRMTRLHLINWHNFHDDIIDFKNITYLLGVNAVGKTTILDAIRYCLTTNKDFNTAGNKKSSRTLLGSVHQKQRAEDSYLRPGHTVSYIGVEFFDEAKDKYFVISVRVESETPKQDLKGVYQDWYITNPGYRLEDIPYFTSIGDGKIPTSRNSFKLDNKGVRASNQADARRRICRILGIGDADSRIGKKFNEVFHMGTSLKDINDIREFIYTYILPEPEVNIDFLQKDMKELERLQEILQEAQDRESLLAQINEKIRDAKGRLKRIRVTELLVAYANMQGILEEKKEAKTNILQWKDSIKVLTDKLNELIEKEEKADDLLYEARRARDENEKNNQMLLLEKEKQENEKEYQKLRNEASKYADLAKQLQQLRKLLSGIGYTVDWDDDLILGDAPEDRKVAGIKKVGNTLVGLWEDMKDKGARIRTDIRGKKDYQTELEDKIRTLESGIMPYPNEAVLVRNSINTYLTTRNKVASARLLCELLYMIDDKWQDAVESYLNTQRFNIIVPPEHYLLAKQAFMELGDEVKGIGLVDTRKLKDVAAENSGLKYLSSTLTSENAYAKRYVEYVMKDVVCCESPDDLEAHSRSVTADRLRFQNYCLQRMRRKDHYIGAEAIEKQLKNARDELRLLQDDLTSLDEQKKAFSSVEYEYTKFTAGEYLVEMERYCASDVKATILWQQINQIKAKIEELNSNPILKSIYDRVSECEANKKTISAEKTDVAAKKQNLEERVLNAENRVQELEGKEDELWKIFEKKRSEYPEGESEAIRKYSEERRNRRASDIAYNFNNSLTQSKNVLNNYITQDLIPLQRNYAATYTCDFPEGLEGAGRYQQEYANLQNIELERHKNNLADAQIRCKQRFRKEVLFRMKDDISRAKQQFNQISRVMKNLEYGEERYQFWIERSKDKELGLFYDIIMDKENQQIDQDGILAYLPEEKKSEVFESQIDDFMSRIMIDVEDHAKDNLTGRKTEAKSIGMYVDYRTYLDYDIIVKNSVTGIEVPLSKVSGEGSGGENQAPFYVAICASLLQIYGQNRDDCIRLILLDEAFNNMTSDRIEPMMNMFKELNLQLVLIATAEKATSIFPYCDMTYAIVKSGNRNAIEVFERI